MFDMRYDIFYCTCVIRQQSKWVSDVPLTYGEVTFDSLHHIFRKMRDLGILPHFNFGALDTSELSFYDLGHGAGRPCLAAACLYPFRNVVGIEVS